MSFDSDWKKATNLVISANEKVVRGAALQLFSAIVLATPVLTGRLRGNWQASMNSRKTGQLATKDGSAGGSATTRKARGELKGYALKDVIYFTNNLPYAAIIEHGGENRRPHGMVRNSVKVFRPALERLAREQKK